MKILINSQIVDLSWVYSIDSTVKDRLVLHFINTEKPLVFEKPDIRGLISFEPVYSGSVQGVPMWLREKFNANRDSFVVFNEGQSHIKFYEPSQIEKLDAVVTKEWDRFKNEIIKKYAGVEKKDLEHISINIPDGQ